MTVVLQEVEGHNHPSKVLAIEDGRLVPYCKELPLLERRQDCEPAYRIVRVLI